tara:strand:- start:973 stop:1698 length:726 start_codon:yes stop_codon:yes gene_type:complete
MSVSGYDAERVNKISQIMPQFAQVAQVGDIVHLGLEGDPLFPSSFSASRPSGTITSIEERANDHLIGMQLQDGSNVKYSSMTLAADQVWEFTDDTFQNVMQRQKEIHRAESPVEVAPESAPQETAQPEYRGTSDDMQSLMNEISALKQQLSVERENNKNFHNTMIASMNEMANDICKLDSSGNNAEFCRTLTSSYGKLMEARAEEQLYRGKNEESDEDDEEDEEEEEEEEDDFSADDTDFF